MAGRGLRVRYPYIICMFQNLFHSEAGDLLVTRVENSPVLHRIFHLLWSGFSFNDALIEPLHVVFFFLYHPVILVACGNQEPLYSWTLGCTAVKAVSRISRVQEPRAACQSDSWRWFSLHFQQDLEVWGRFFKYIILKYLSLVLFRSPNSLLPLLSGFW